MAWMTNEFGFNSQQRSDYVLYGNKTSSEDHSGSYQMEKGAFPKI
jgi:hypothetical protein